MGCFIFKDLCIQAHAQVPDARPTPDTGPTQDTGPTPDTRPTPGSGEAHVARENPHTPPPQDAEEPQG